MIDLREKKTSKHEDDMEIKFVNKGDEFKSEKADDVKIVDIEKKDDKTEVTYKLGDEEKKGDIEDVLKMLNGAEYKKADDKKDEKKSCESKDDTEETPDEETPAGEKKTKEESVEDDSIEVTLTEDFHVPGTDIILEAGDRVRLIESSSDLEAQVLKIQQDLAKHNGSSYDILSVLVTENPQYQSYKGKRTELNMLNTEIRKILKKHGIPSVWSGAIVEKDDTTKIKPISDINFDRLVFCKYYDPRGANIYNDRSYVFYSEEHVKWYKVHPEEGLVLDGMISVNPDKLTVAWLRGRTWSNDYKLTERQFSVLMNYIEKRNFKK